MGWGAAVGKVEIYLHPSFGRWAHYKVDAVDGIAQDTITSYGAFTIGAEILEDHTRLELDLTRVDGGTQSFYEN